MHTLSQSAPPNILITVCARGGSKGVPGKNIKPILGKPLIAHTINTAQLFAQNHQADIILSTDDPKIQAVAAEYGLSTDYRRPAELATDQAGKVGVIRHAWQYAEVTLNKQYDYVLDLDVASPLRTQKDLELALKKIQSTPQAIILFSVNEAAHNPYFTIVEEADNGTVKLSKRLDQPVLGRQAAPRAYDLNGAFYYYSRTFLEGDYTSVTLDGQSTIYVMPHICFDIDTPLDFAMMEFVLEKKLFEF